MYGISKDVSHEELCKKSNTAEKAEELVVWEFRVQKSFATDGKFCDYLR